MDTVVRRNCVVTPRSPNTQDDGEEFKDGKGREDLSGQWEVERGTENEKEG